jgi:hypothetical protein
MTAAVPDRAGYPITPTLPGTAGGELVQSLTYRETYSRAPAYGSSVYDPPARHRNAPRSFSAVAGAAWALVSIAAAGSVLLVLVLVLIRVVGWLT